MIKRLAHKLFLKLPDNVHLNKLHMSALFWVAHRRLPRRNSGLFSDYLYYLRAEPHLDPDLELRRKVTDKLFAKDYCRSVLGRDIAPQTIRVFETAEEVSESCDLPRCIIKPAHAGGGIVLFHGGGRLGVEQASIMRSWFDLDVYRDRARLPNYFGVRKRVFCEQLVAEAEEIRDYKVFCVRGAPKAIQVDSDRYSGHKRRLYAADWEPLPYAFNYPLAPPEPKPAQLREMLDTAARLSSGFQFIRVDFYLAGEGVWFGEFGNYPDAGSGRFEAADAEMHFSELLFNQLAGT